MSCARVLAQVYNEFASHSEFANDNQIPKTGTFYSPIRRDRGTGLWVSITFGVFEGGSAILTIYNPSEPIVVEPGMVYVRFTAHDTGDPITSNISTTRKVGLRIDGPNGTVCTEICASVERGFQRAILLWRPMSHLDCR